MENIFYGIIEWFSIVYECKYDWSNILMPYEYVCKLFYFCVHKLTLFILCLFNLTLFTLKLLRTKHV